MGVMSQRMMPICDSLCVCCPAMRPRSRHPVKRYKKLISDILPKHNNEEEPNDRKIGKLCEYAAKNPLRVPKITSILEQRCYRELRHENINSVKAVMCIYRKLIVSCQQHMPLFAGSFLSIVQTLLDQATHIELQMVGCHALFDFINNQKDSTYMFNLDGLIPKLCGLAQDMGTDEKSLQLRCAGLQALSSTIWFMGEVCHISTDFDNVVSAVLENCQEQAEESNYPNNTNQDAQNNPEELKSENETSSSSTVMTHAVSWRKIVNEKDFLTTADTGNPKFWSRVCLNNMAKLAREATTVRRVLEALFRYFDQSNLWSPDHGLALTVLLDMQSIMEISGHDTHFLLSTVIKHLHHKNVLNNSEMQIDIVQVATSLARSTKMQPSATIIGAFSDMMRHLRKIIHCSLNDSELGDEIVQWNRKFHRAIDECLVELSYKIGDAGPILDVMAVMLESISNVNVMARNTIATIYRAAQLVAFLPNILYQNKAFPEALFHQILLAMVVPDHETRLGAHRIFSVVLVPSSVCPYTSSNRTSTSKGDLERTLSRSVSVFSSSAALFGKLIKGHTSLQSIGDQTDEILTDVEGTKNPSMLDRLKSSYSRNTTIKRHSCPVNMGNLENEPKGISLKLKTRQISLLLSSIWVQAVSHLNTPANYEAISHSYCLVVLFSQNKKSRYESLVRSFQLAFSLRSISLQGGDLPPSRCRSLFTLATSMIVFLSKAYSFLPIVTSAKSCLMDKVVDPFLRLEDDCKLKALDTRLQMDTMVKVYGSKEDDEDALKSLSATHISEDQSTESFASMIVKDLEKLPSSELSSLTLQEQLLKDFVPDDVCPLGAQLVTKTPGQSYRSGSKELSEVHSIFSSCDEYPTDSFVSQSDSCSQLTLESPRLLSVNQLLDMVSETTKEVVARFSISTPSDLPFKDMATNCESLQNGKQQVISNFIASTIHENSGSLSIQDNVHVQNTISYEHHDPENYKTSITSFSIPCASDYQHNPNLFHLPTTSPYDNFLKAAGS